MPKIGMKPIQREKILTATLRCAAIEGLEKITLESIAKEAEISKGIISYYFKSKRNVFLNAYQSLLEGYNSALEEAFLQAKTMKELFYIISGTMIKEDASCFIPGITKNDFRKLIIQFYSLIATDDKFRAMVQSVYYGFLETFRKIIDEGIKRKEFRNKQHDYLAYGMLAQLDGLILYNIMGFSLPGMTTDVSARKLIDLWLD